MIVTQKAIARELGISVSTVSRALRGNPHISAETRRRVAEAAQRLGHQPNLLAASLRTGVTRIIGLIVTDITDPYYGEVARGVEDCAYEQGYSVLLSMSDRSLEREKLCLEVLRSRRVDGIILTPVSTDVGARQGLVDAGIPYVLFDALDVPDDASTVSSDHAEGVYTAVRHLIELGHQHIAFIGGDPKLPPARMMYTGYRQALSEAGLKCGPEWVCREASAMEGGYSAAAHLLDSPNPPTGAVCCTDLMVIGAIQAVEERGKRVPEDFSIVGYDDIPMASHIKPPLTTIMQNKRELGAICTRILMHEINTGPGCMHQQTILKPRLVVRRSTAPPR